MILGVTGTREGMTEPQRLYLLEFLGNRSDFRWLYHGDCKGVDSEAHDMAKNLGLSTHGFPGLLTQWQAARICTIKEPPAPELERNRTIVDRCDFLIAFPAQRTERRRGSGTWATIRYARKVHRDMVIVYPDGGLGQ